MKITANRGRKAISPIIATVLIIAVTLIAAVAIGGFVFGLFGSSSNTAQVSVVSVAIPSSGLGSGGLAATCTATTGDGTVVFTNSGTIGTSVVGLTLTYLGKTYSTTAAISCPVAAGSTVTVGISSLGSVSPSSGQQFTGYASTSNGAQVTFAGTFS